MTGDLHHNHQPEDDQRQSPVEWNPTPFVRGYRQGVRDAIRSLLGDAVAWRRLGRMIGAKDEGEDATA